MAPFLFFSKCDKCDFRTSISTGSMPYVRDENGNKVRCSQPGETDTVAEVLKISRDVVDAWFRDKDKVPEEVRKKIEENVGMMLQHICLECLSETFIDLKREKLKCSNCGSANLMYVTELEGKLCPKCKLGIIKRVDQGIV